MIDISAELRVRIERLTKEMVDQGKLIEAGWLGLRLAAIPPDASAVQLDEMRMAFFAGAQHLFGSIMSMLDPGEGETPDDMRRMELISAELDGFAEGLALRIMRPAGQS